MNENRPIVPNEITMQSAGARRRVDPLQLASIGQARARSSALSTRDFVAVGCAIIFVAVVGLLCLLQSAEITRLAYRVNERRAEAERLVEVNSVLEAEILELSRLDRIEARAEALGLAAPEEILYLDLSGTEPPVDSVVDEAQGQ